MYGVAGERRLTEFTARLAARVRELDARCGVGNAASEQFQLDVYGEVLAHAVPHAAAASPTPAAHRDSWDLEHGAARARSRTSGASPTRASGRCAARAQHFTHSKVHGVAGRSTARCATSRTSASRDRSSGGGAIRDEIHAQICDEGFDAELNAFTQAYGSKRLDAAVLLMPMVGLPPRRPIRGCVGTVERDRAARSCTTASSPGTRRARTARSTGCPPGEGTFLPCSFWLADNLALIGREDDAVAMFERLLGAAQRRRPARRGVRPRCAAASSATSRRRSPTSASSTPPPTCRARCRSRSATTGTPTRRRRHDEQAHRDRDRLRGRGAPRRVLVRRPGLGGRRSRRGRRRDRSRRQRS